MARKDNKGRNLKIGESQRKDGRYMYRYVDERSGKRLTIYDDDLMALRNREQQIVKDIDDDIVTDPESRNMTLNKLFEQNMLLRKLAPSTRMNYQRLWNTHVRNNIGQMKVIFVKPSHIKLFYAELTRKKLAHNTIKIIHNLIYPSFEMALDDDLIRKNPSRKTLKDNGMPPKKKQALTRRQQKNLLDFVDKSAVYNVYLPLLQIMIETGFRCGEIIGLTWSDVDMKKKVISINHQLVYKDFGDGNGHCFHITMPKTEAGIRRFPMTDNVYKAFETQRKQNFMLGLHGTANVDGFTRFIFNSKNDNPIMPGALNNVLYNAVNAYNLQETDNAKKEKREPELIPKISAHILRHTGCTRMAESGMDMKVVQYLMGHANIDVTMDVYNHITEDSRIETELVKFKSGVV